MRLTLKSVSFLFYRTVKMLFTSLGHFERKIILWIVILIIACLSYIPYFFLKQWKDYYGVNQNISEKLMDRLIAFHFVTSIIAGITLTKYAQFKIVPFKQLVEREDFIIPISFVIGSILCAIPIGIAMSVVVNFFDEEKKIEK